MIFQEAYGNSTFLMEGALGERLKREYGICPDPDVALAAHIYEDKSRLALQSLWEGYLSIAQKYRLPFLATTPTRRANKERIALSKYSETIIHDNVGFLKSIQDRSSLGMYIGALIGCKGDAYKATDILSETEAQRFHGWAIERFALSGIDFFYAGIMPALSEAAGMARALSEVGLPYIISFMIRDNGCLIDGTTIHDAIAYIDTHTDKPPICYMTNCVHPDILYKALSHSFNINQTVRSRFCGIQANTSPLSPEELENAKELHVSNPYELSDSVVRLKNIIQLKIVGGCCGTDDSYLNAIASQL